MPDMNQILPSGQQPEEDKNSSRKLTEFAAGFSNSVKALVMTVFWLVIGFAVLAAAFVAVRVIIVAAKQIMQTVGI